MLSCLCLGRCGSGQPLHRRRCSRGRRGLSARNQLGGRGDAAWGGCLHKLRQQCAGHQGRSEGRWPCISAQHKTDARVWRAAMPGTQPTWGRACLHCTGRNERLQDGQGGLCVSHAGLESAPGASCEQPHLPATALLVVVPGLAGPHMPPHLAFCWSNMAGSTSLVPSATGTDSSASCGSRADRCSNQASPVARRQGQHWPAVPTQAGALQTHRCTLPGPAHPNLRGCRPRYGVKRDNVHVAGAVRLQHAIWGVSLHGHNTGLLHESRCSHQIALASRSRASVTGGKLDTGHSISRRPAMHACMHPFCLRRVLPAGPS